MHDTSRHGVAIIGLGTVGRRFIEQFGNHEDFDVIGGFDVGQRARDAAAADFGITVVETAAELIENRSDFGFGAGLMCASLAAVPERLRR